MAFFKVALVFVACLLQEAQCSSSQQKYPIEVTLDAAYSSNYGDIALFAGDNLMIVNGKMRTGTVPMSWREMSYNRTGLSTIQACFLSFKGHKGFFYGNTTVVRMNRNDGKNVTYDFYDYSRGGRSFMANGGPDAVARKGDKRYVFKGCQYVVRDSVRKFSKPKSVKELGLPCHIDAAWRTGNDMILVRGDQVWIWREDNSVGGPFSFNKVLSIQKYWTLKPYTGPED